MPLFKLAAAMHAETLYRQYGFAPEKALKRLWHWITSPDSVILVADQDGEAVGMFAADVYAPWFTDDTLALEGCFFVLPEHRGSRAGYMLMRTFYEWAHERGASHIQAGVSSGLGPAGERLYQHFGLEHLGGNYARQLTKAAAS